MTETRLTEIDPAADELDRIERSIDIDAPAERVFDLVSRPGWYVNDGEVDPDPVIRREGDLEVLEHPTWGEFRFATVALDRPRRAAFRWVHREGSPNELGELPATLVEFTIVDRPGGVTLTVVESGFSTLRESRDEWLEQRQGNVEGWGKQLPAARRFVETRLATP